MEENKEQFENFKKEAKETLNDLKDGANNFIDEASETMANQKSKRILVGVIAIILGALGIHKFVLGYTKEGLIMLIGGVVTCGTITPILGLIEGIVYLTKSDEEFYNTYEVGYRPWF